MKNQPVIEVVVADWVGLKGPTLMGHLTATPVRGKEVFAFEYDRQWLSTDKASKTIPTMIAGCECSLHLVAPSVVLVPRRACAMTAVDCGSRSFPSLRDEDDIGAWELVVHDLAKAAGIVVPDAELRRFGSGKKESHGHHTFLSRRFDRTAEGRRLHFASAMTLLDYGDSQGAEDGVSYVELANLLMRLGSRPSADLEQLWRRIVFSICVSNTDDHLRNHGFMLEPTGWAPARERMRRAFRVAEAWAGD